MEKRGDLEKEKVALVLERFVCALLMALNDSDDLSLKLVFIKFINNNLYLLTLNLLPILYCDFLPTP